MKFESRILTTVAGLLFAFAANGVYADSGNVKILSPLDDAALLSTAETYVEYEFEKGDKGDHIHIWIDGEKSPAQRAAKGSYELPKMTPGKHAVIAKLVDKGHVPVGPEKSIFVTVK